VNGNRIRSTSFRYAVRSDRGTRARNEDAVYADSHVLALADGMGGHPAGDIAAASMVRPFSEMPPETPGWDVVDYLRAATLQGEDAIAAFVDAHPECRGMGTTLTAVMLVGSRLGLVHAGDSRAYVSREGRLYQLSRDDTLVQSLVDGGAIPAATVRSHPQRHVVLRALVGHDTRLSLASYDVLVGDRVVLCSDGVSDVLSDDFLGAAVSERDPSRCASDVADSALAVGSRDNVTCVVAEVVRGESGALPLLAGAARGS
jgi:serine/threonine protein phosphatase PrpC